MRTHAIENRISGFLIFVFTEKLQPSKTAEMEVTMASADKKKLVKKRVKRTPYRESNEYSLAVSVSLACEQFFRRKGIVDDWQWLNLSKAQEQGKVIQYGSPKHEHRT